MELIDEFYLLAQVHANVQRPNGNVAGARRATRGARTAQDTITDSSDARADVSRGLCPAWRLAGARQPLRHVG